MTEFLVVALLLCLLIDGVYRAMAWDDADFFSNCPPSRCSKHGPEIRYPFRLESSNTSSLCGTPCMKLGCYGDDTILVLPTAVIHYKVTAIDYRRGTLTLAPRVDDSSSSCKQKLMSVSLPSNLAANYIFGPISCLSSTSQFSYLVDSSASMSVLPLDCKVAPDSHFPIHYDGPTLKEQAEAILDFSGTTTIDWIYGEDFPGALYNCTQCEQGGRHCGFSL